MKSLIQGKIPSYEDRDFQIVWTFSKKQQDPIYNLFGRLLGRSLGMPLGAAQAPGLPPLEPCLTTRLLALDAALRRLKLHFQRRHLTEVQWLDEIDVLFPDSCWGTGFGMPTCMEP